MKKVIVMLCALLALTNVASAAYWSFFDNGGGDQLWSNPLNWDTDLVPDLSGTNPDYSAGLNTIQPPLLIDGVAQAPHFISNVWGQAPGANDAEILAGADFVISNTAKIGYVGPSVMTNHGGTWTIGTGDLGGNLFIGGEDQVGGDGAYIQHAGSLNMKGLLLIGGQKQVAGSKGLLRLSGGTVTVGGALEINSDGLVDIGDGDLYIPAGDPAATAALLDGYIAGGAIIGYGGSGTVAYELSGDRYHVYGVPEPATVTLIGLGGLVLVLFGAGQGNCPSRSPLHLSDSAVRYSPRSRHAAVDCAVRLFGHMVPGKGRAMMNTSERILRPIVVLSVLLLCAVPLYGEILLEDEFEFFELGETWQEHDAGAPDLQLSSTGGVLRMFSSPLADEFRGIETITPISLAGLASLTVDARLQPQNQGIMGTVAAAEVALIGASGEFIRAFASNNPPDPELDWADHYEDSIGNTASSAPWAHCGSPECPAVRDFIITINSSGITFQSFDDQEELDDDDNIIPTYEVSFPDFTLADLGGSVTIALRQLIVEGGDNVLGDFDRITVTGEAGGVIPGDFDGNGVLDSADIDELTAATGAGSTDLQYDVNNDSLVNGTDVNFWAKQLKKTWIGDANCDLEFNSADFVQAFSRRQVRDGSGGRLVPRGLERQRQVRLRRFRRRVRGRRLRGRQAAGSSSQCCARAVVAGTADPGWTCCLYPSSFGKARAVIHWPA